VFTLHSSFGKLSLVWYIGPSLVTIWLQFLASTFGFYVKMFNINNLFLKTSKRDHDPISNYVSSKEISKMCYMFQARET